MEFRIRLYLYHYFFDHRKTCLIYTKKNIKTIKDLKAYISKQFEIDGEFYLTCNDYYLPHSEDIRVLYEDDTVVVVPQIPRFEERAQSVTPKKIKKDKKIEKEKKEVQVTPAKKKEDDGVVVKRKKVEEDLEMVVDEVDHGNKIETPEAKCKGEIWNTAVREYTRKRKIDLLPISTTPNIVESIIVHDNVTNGLDSKQVTETSSSDSDISVDTPPITTMKRQSVDSDVSQSKRKRKRNRKRRKSVPVIQVTSARNTVAPVALVLGTPSLHIRFDEPKIETWEETEVHAKKEPEEIMKDEPEEKETEVIELGEKTADTTVNYDELCKREIGAFPLMQDRNPNVDDVVAFKRYMLSEAFTPEISNYIVGRITKFCPTSHEVIVKILEGLDQCKEPEGKFFWYEDVEEEERSPNRDEKKFVWTELIEQRLLFP